MFKKQPMKAFLLLPLFCFCIETEGVAQNDSPRSLKNSIQVKLEASLPEAHYLPGISFMVKVYLKNLTKDKIHLEKNSCYQFEKYFHFKDSNYFITPKIFCSFSYQTVQTILPKETIEFEVYVYSLNGIPKKEIDIGLELIKVPEKHVNENISFISTEERKEFESFIFWDVLKGYSFSIKVPSLKI